MFLLPLAVLFIVVPIAELYVILQVGHAIGTLWTVALLLADSVLGSLLLRAQGRITWRRFNAALAAGRPPAREVLDGGLVIFGGAFLITPGFLTDVVGVVLLLPPTRAAVRRLLLRHFTNQAFARVMGGFGGRRAASHAYDVEGAAVELEAPPRRARRFRPR